MPLVPQPLPWTPLPGREIGDSAGNVVQYTQATIGQICLAVNAHDRLIDTLGKVETWLHSDPASRLSVETLLELISSATGRIGCGALAAKLEGEAMPSVDLDRQIATELNIPEADYTSSVGSARSLLSKGWRISDWEEERINPATNQPAIYIVVELKSGDKAITATSLTLPLAICAAALKAKEA